MVLQPAVKDEGNYQAATNIDITSYTQANPYLCTTDGYVMIACPAGDGICTVQDIGPLGAGAVNFVAYRRAGAVVYSSFFVKKGLKIYGASSNPTGTIIYFRGLGTY